jgi:hypothetical protein
MEAIAPYADTVRGLAAADASVARRQNSRKTNAGVVSNH